jgi:hypothetical protein
MLYTLLSMLSILSFKFRVSLFTLYILLSFVSLSLHWLGGACGISLRDIATCTNLNLSIVSHNCEFEFELNLRLKFELTTEFPLFVPIARGGIRAINPLASSLQPPLLNLFLYSRSKEFLKSKESLTMESRRYRWKFSHVG